MSQFTEVINREEGDNLKTKVMRVVLAFQHLIAMFGATVLVPFLTGLNPSILRITAIIAIVLSFVAKFGEVIRSVPEPVMEGISLILFSMIAKVGPKTMKSENVKYTWKNIIVIATIIIIGLGGNFGLPFEINLGNGVSIAGLSLAAIVGVLINLGLNGRKRK